ncbi:hypothetical protein ACTXT7_015956 [Hymenolepis weldensis]
MLNSIAAGEVAAVVDVIKDPSNEILECHLYTENSLYFSIKGVGYPSERLEICQLSNGTTVGVVKQSILNIIDAVLMIMMIICIEFKKPMPNLANRYLLPVHLIAMIEGWCQLTSF